MGASPTWFDDYLAKQRADATGVKPALTPQQVLAAKPTNTVGPTSRPDWAMHDVPKAFGDKTQGALNLLGVGNPLPAAYDAYEKAGAGDQTGAGLALAGAIPLIPEGEGARAATEGLSLLGHEVNPIMRVAARAPAGMVEGYVPGAAAVAVHGAEHAQSVRNLLPQARILEETAHEHVQNARQLLSLGANDAARTRVEFAFAKDPRATAAYLEKHPELAAIPSGSHVAPGMGSGVVTGEDPALLTRTPPAAPPPPPRPKPDMRGKGVPYDPTTLKLNEGLFK